MSNSVLYWLAAVTTFLAGVGVVPTVQLFRAPYPGHRVRGGEPAGQPIPSAAAQPAAPRTVHHDYDTGAVYADGLADGFQARPVRRPGELEFGTAGIHGWESGSGGPPVTGNGTWEPRPRPYTDGIVPSGGGS